MKLVLFCDYGLDDAAATVDALMHAREDGYDRVDLVAVGGNVPSEVALLNAKKLVANLPFALPAVRIVDTTAYPQPSEYLSEIHGGDGMGDLFGEKAFQGEILSFERWRALDEPFILLSLGPMTLVPYALEKQPVRFLFMGGCIRETPNYGAYEFNHGVNPAAFCACVTFPHVAITMDTCRHPLFNIQEKKIGEGDLLRRIVARSRELTLSSGEKGCYVWDDIAVKALRHPEWFEVRKETDRDGNLLSVARYIGKKEYLDVIGL